MDKLKTYATADSIFSTPETDRSLFEITEGSGGLYLKWCSGDLCMITNWEGGLRVLRKHDGDWLEGSIFHDNWASMLLRWRDEGCSWLNSIPQYAIDQATKHKSIEFGLLRIAARNKVAYDKLLDSPLSLALIYDHCIENNLTTQHLHRYTTCPYDRMYQTMAIPYDLAVTRFIHQIEVESFSKSEYRRIKNICRSVTFPEDWIDIPTINSDGLRIMEAYPSLVGSKLLNNMIREKNGLSTEKGIWLMLSNYYFFSSKAQFKKLGSVKTLEELESFTNKIV